MAKTVSHYVCQKCGYESPKWMGQCGGCGEWNSLVETLVSTKSMKGKRQGTAFQIKVEKLSEVKIETANKGRVKTGIGEFDRVLGGGMVAGSVVLVGGEPGIGKSTILTQLALQVAEGKQAKKVKRVLYVCGEESPEQVKMRAQRLQSGRRMKGEAILLLPSTNVDEIVSFVESSSTELSLIIIDSVQSLFTEDLTGTAGSVGQVRESANRLQAIAKRYRIPVFLVGHVTKTGAIAGPKVLEHLVDVVLELYGERTGSFRILRTLKNRFGATDEVGVFEMREAGLTEVTNPSEAFLEESQAGTPGSVTVAIMEGTRPVLVEIQALVVNSQLAVPRRVAHGVPINKIQLLAAVLQKRCGMSGLGSSDIFVNVAGGIEVREPAADLGIALAMASSLKNKALPKKMAVFSEVGLLGELRRVNFASKRVNEAKKLGYAKVVSSGEVKTLAQVVRELLG